MSLAGWHEAGRLAGQGDPAKLDDMSGAWGHHAGDDATYALAALAEAVRGFAAGLGDAIDLDAAGVVWALGAAASGAERQAAEDEARAAAHAASGCALSREDFGPEDAAFAYERCADGGAREDHLSEREMMQDDGALGATKEA